ncbi:MAG: UDP-2,3-diacylglucosamine diphosphatase [bacterium]|nr:UDP-2,3-diacylglucosamine diphosphatase [bacterium]
MSIPFYFLSDVHLGAGSPELERLKLARLKKLFAVIRDQPGPLYILGDLFDFWFEYRAVIQSEHFEVLAEMLKLRQSGVEITLLAGNHDYWTGPFLEKQLGFKIVKDDLTIDLDGQKVLLCHGDGLDQTDRGYRALKAVLRNPLSIRAFSLIHPDLAVSFAHWFSRFSRNHLTKHKNVDQAPLERQAARFFALGYRAVVFGHTHQPTLKDMEGHVFLNLGDFFKNFTYAIYRNGKFKLEKIID